MLANLTDAQAFALWDSLAQWCDNEESRDDVESEDEINPHAITLRPVIAALDAVIASAAER